MENVFWMILPPNTVSSGEIKNLNRKRKKDEKRYHSLIFMLSPHQTIATFQRNTSQHCWAQHIGAFGHPVATCCDMLSVVDSNLEMAKFFMQLFWMLQHIVHPGMRTSSVLNTQHVAKGWPNLTTCCAQQWSDILRWNVAIFWPELANVGPTMLGYVVIQCLARALRCNKLKHFNDNDAMQM